MNRKKRFKFKTLLKCFIITCNNKYIIHRSGCEPPGLQFGHFHVETNNKHIVARQRERRAMWKTNKQTIKQTNKQTAGLKTETGPEQQVAQHLVCYIPSSFRPPRTVVVVVVVRVSS